MAFGEELRKRRLARGMTQKRLSELANIKQSYLSQLESGVRDAPSLDVIERLAQALDCPVSALRDRTDTDSLSWFWRAWLAGFTEGELLHISRTSVEERAALTLRHAVEVLGRDYVLGRTGLTTSQLDDLMAIKPRIMPVEVDHINRLDLPPGFLRTGSPPPGDEDLRTVLSAPDSAVWVKIMARCIHEQLLPESVDLLVSSLVAANRNK